jgi:pheromone receptor transcription factor
MADITDPTGLDHPSPGDDLAGNGVDSRGTKRPRASMAGDDDDDDDEKGGRERRKIEIKFIQDKSRRHITFSKRKAGIMKKVSTPEDLSTQLLLTTVVQAYELSVLTGTQVLLLVVSETGLVYTFTTPKLQPLVTKAEGKNLIQVRILNPYSDSMLILVKACLNAPEPSGTENGVDAADDVPSPEDVPAMPPAPVGGARPPPQHAPGPYGMTPEQQQALYYQQMQQNQSGQYGGMPQMPQHQRA